ncbi:MAG: hypothetical protein MUO23_11080 [Anaerolineales bacterium]|nr:hypothetical protein [Anaerolineales bacterium]
MDTLVKVEARPIRRRWVGRRHGSRPEAGPGSVGEVYVEPDGMVDVALRELGARLAVDDPDSPESHSAG